MVRSSAWGQPTLNGLLIASDPLVGTAWRQAEAQIRAEAQARLRSDNGEVARLTCDRDFAGNARCSRVDAACGARQHVGPRLLRPHRHRRARARVDAGARRHLGDEGVEPDVLAFGKKTQVCGFGMDPVQFGILMVMIVPLGGMTWPSGSASSTQRASQQSRPTRGRRVCRR